MLFPQCVRQTGWPQQAFSSHGTQLWVGYRGSLAHKTHIPPDEPFGTDDKDVIGVFIAPREHYLGIKRHKETIEWVEGSWDCVNYEFLHYIKLLLQQNPNVLTTLWPPEDTVLYQHPTFNEILKAREAFVSKKALNPFMGYASQQLKKMTSTPAPSAERKAEIHTLKTEVAYRQNRLPEDPPYLDPATRSMSVQEMRTRVNVLKGQTGYMGEKRKKNVETFGYDVKNAAHLVRLLRMGAEFFREGRIIVDREEVGDADLYRGIKTGKWSLDNIKVLGDVLKEDIQAAHDHSKIPEEPNREAVNELCMGILGTHL